ncbi:MAG TPA: AAA family ATPase [Symbiobacteriaceae bacterium]|nr:AAA family ATPase [Symbiobacteriaceae bacterium]
MLDALTIHRYAGLRNFHLELPNGTHPEFGNLRICLIVGENGTGKTTLLRAMTMAFTYAGRPHPRFHITYEHGYAPQGKPRIITSTYAVVDGFARLPDRGPEPVVDHIHLSPTRIGSVRRLEASILENINSNEPQRRKAANEILSHIGLSEPTHYQFEWRFGSDPRLISERQLHAEKVHNLLTAAGAKWEIHETPFRASVRRTVKGTISVRDVNEAFPDGIETVYSLLRGLRDGGSQWYSLPGLVFPRQDESISINDLSSGERTMLYRFFPLLDAVQDEAVILIDEPETHLHPKWIQEFVAMLVSVFKSYHAQFILASHSPLIAADLPADCIVGLKRVKGTIQSAPITVRSLGGNPAEILESVFGVDDYRGVFTQSVMKKLKQAIKKQNLPEAERLYALFAQSEEKLELFRELRRLREEQES